MPTSRPQTERGYTLLEMLLVLIILGIGATIAASALSGRPSSVERERIAGRIRLALTDARARAEQSGRPQRLPLAGFGKPGELLSLHDSVNGSKNAIIAFSDGSTSGGTIDLDGRPVLAVSWLIGAAGDGR